MCDNNEIGMDLEKSWGNDKTFSSPFIFQRESVVKAVSCLFTSSCLAE